MGTHHNSRRAERPHRGKAPAIHPGATRGCAAALAMAGLLVVVVLPALAFGYEESSQIGQGRTTHQVLMDRMVGAIDRDGHPELASYLRTYAAALKTGSIRADWTLFDSREHYMDPYTGAGLLGFRSAGSLGREKAAAAVEAWRQGDRQSALESLGRVLHLIQDLTVPHHSRLTPLDYHAVYEAWVTDHVADLPEPAHGVYAVDPANATGPTDPYPWIVAAGRASHPRFDLVDGPDGVGGRNYSRAAGDLVPLAVALSAGYMETFFEHIDTGPPVIAWSVPSDGHVGAPVEMACVECSDDSEIARYVWTLGDGRVMPGPIIHPVFDTAGVVDVNLEVVDIVGKRSELSGRVRISDPLGDNAPPRSSGWEYMWGAVLVSAAAASAMVFVRRHRKNRTTQSKGSR